VRNSERLAKYNQLLRIGEDTAIGFAGFAVPRPAALEQAATR
jgi:enolase